MALFYTLIPHYIPMYHKWDNENYSYTLFPIIFPYIIPYYIPYLHTENLWDMLA